MTDRKEWPIRSLQDALDFYHKDHTWGRVYMTWGNPLIGGGAKCVVMPVVGGTAIVSPKEFMRLQRLQRDRVENRSR